MSSMSLDVKSLCEGVLHPRIRVVRQECRTHAGYFNIISFFTAVNALPVPDAGVAFMRMK